MDSNTVDHLPPVDAIGETSMAATGTVALPFIEQREGLEHQTRGEQQKLDEDFLVALEHRMPRPAASASHRPPLHDAARAREHP